MLSRSIYCAACGGPVRLDTIDIAMPCNNEDTKSSYWTYDGSMVTTEDTQWISKFRLLGPKGSIPVLEPSSGSSSPSTPASPASPQTPPSTSQLPKTPLQQQQKQQKDSTSIKPAVEIAVSLPAEWVDWTEVCFPSSEKPEKLYTVYAASDHYVKREFLVPIHEACLELVKCVSRNLKYQTRKSEEIESRATCALSEDKEALLRFYSALQRRRQQNVQQAMVFPTYASTGGIEWSHGYYGVRGFWGHGWISKRGSEHVISNPYSVPTVSEHMISCLDKLDTNSDVEQEEEEKAKQMLVVSAATACSDSSHLEIPSTCSQLESLPAPAMDCLLAQLSISDAIRLRDCSKRTREETVRLTPRFWRDRLLSGEAVDWIWDLNLDMAVKAGVGRDWEGLVREMKKQSVKPVWAGDDEPGQEALGLRNRRRVVAIVKEILNY